MKVVLIPFWFPLVNGGLRGFLFFICIKMVYSVFKMTLYYMKHYYEIYESGFKFHFDSLLWRCFPGKFWKNLYQNGVFWEHFEGLWTFL